MTSKLAGMRRRPVFALTIAIGDAPNAAAQDEMADNPFFAESPLPHQLPPFDRIDDAHYAPAFERGMADQIAEIEAIAGASEPPTFENTIVALERSGQLLNRVAATFFALSSADTNDAINAIRNEMAPRLAAHTDRMLLDAGLFARVEALYEQRDATSASTTSRGASSRSTTSTSCGPGRGSPTPRRNACRPSTPGWRRCRADSPRTCSTR